MDEKKVNDTLNGASGGLGSNTIKVPSTIKDLLRPGIPEDRGRNGLRVALEGENGRQVMPTKQVTPVGFEGGSILPVTNPVSPSPGVTPATGATAPAADTTVSASETTAQPKFAYEDPALSAHINSMYDAYANARKTSLQEAGDQALSDAQANRDKIAEQYQTQRNAASADWERQRRNFMESANMNGLNTGVGGQAQLAMMGKYQQTQNNFGSQQAQAEAEANRNMADIKRQTQAQINEAIAENDYKRAAALLDQYNVMYQRALEKAQALAQYGDFSGYGTIYGDDTASQMTNMWYAQNPDLAYMMGLITKDQRQNIKSGKPINDGLDENGVRIKGAGGGNSGYNWSQQFYDQAYRDRSAPSAPTLAQVVDANRAAGKETVVQTPSGGSKVINYAR